MPSIYPCPKCGEYHYHKSHARDWYERLRKSLFNHRVFRCHECGYRGWIRISKLKGRAEKRMVFIYIVVLVIASLVGMALKSMLQ